VQDKLWSERDMVRKLIMDEKASIYLCGSLNMAEGVKKTINEIVSGSSLSNGHLEKMKKERRLQEDVWAS
jgi:sulfite reductase alpha subunit-like flavoprotein